MASDRERKPPPKRRRQRDEPRIDTRPPTQDDERHAEELIRKHGWDHLREKS